MQYSRTPVCKSLYLNINSMSAIYRNAFTRLHRAYPSLNLNIHVSVGQNAVQVVLPGLRFDDIDHTGQPNISTVFDMVNHVETAALGYEHSFLDYISLRKQNLRSYVKACVLDIRSDFYETTTPKAPLDIQIKLTDIGSSTFTTVSEMFCGGKLSPSIRVKNLHTLVQKGSNTVQELPDWWRTRFEPRIEPSIKTNRFHVSPADKGSHTHTDTFTVPLSDTDHNERTRCGSYVRYFMNNSSVASRREEFKNIKSSFHEFHIKRLQMLYYRHSNWGETLTSETWEDTHNPLILHCLVHRNGHHLWYSQMDLYKEVFGLPKLKLEEKVEND